MTQISSAKVLFGCFNTIFFGCGFLKVVCGFLLLSDTRRILLSRLLAMPEGGLQEPPFYYVALALLAAGLIICTVAAIGVWATYLPGYVILTFYFLVVLGLLVCECAGGALAAVWPRCYGVQAARGGPVGALRAHYAVPDFELFTAALDLAQTELQCCGMASARDYDLSQWQLRRLGPRGVAAPPSCCAQRGRASHLDPAPRNLSRCQEPRPDPLYRHVPGCQTKLEDWYQEQYFVFMLALFVVAVFKLAILLSTVFSCIKLRKSKKEKRFFTIRSRSMHNKSSENIYERNMSLHDEPITAKYIQPNNFYSPRVRNPRIFNKPNEMV